MTGSPSSTDTWIRILSGAAAIDLDVGMARDGLKDALRQTVDRNEMTDNVTCV